jgi:hypothetical protein
MRRVVFVVIVLLAFVAIGAAYIGGQLGPEVLHPERLNSLRMDMAAGAPRVRHGNRAGRIPAASDPIPRRPLTV